MTGCTFNERFSRGTAIARIVTGIEHQVGFIFTSDSAGFNKPPVSRSIACRIIEIAIDGRCEYTNSHTGELNANGVIVLQVNA
jgi:hypothetical protein